MKSKFFLVSGVFLAGLFLSSCNLFFGTSIEDRIAQFESDLNTDSRSSIIDNFSKSDCEDYNSINDLTYWNDTSIFCLANKPFSLSVSEGNESASGTMTYGDPSAQTSISFVLVDEGSVFTGADWKITQVWLDGSQAIKILAY